MDALIQNAIRTSEIEGECLDVGSVSSSVICQLGELIFRESLCHWRSMLLSN